MIQQILNIEELSYTSNLSEENLKKRIEDISEQETLRLAGKITSKNEFTAYDKWVIIGWNMPNLKRKAAYLKGKITQSEKGLLIELKVNPNSILPIFAILATFMGVIITVLTYSNTENETSVMVFGIVLIVLGVIYYVISTLLRNRLRNKIVKYLSLNKV